MSCLVPYGHTCVAIVPNWVAVLIILPFALTMAIGWFCMLWDVMDVVSDGLRAMFSRERNEDKPREEPNNVSR